MKARFYALYGIAALIIAVDQWTKYWVVNHILPFMSYDIIPNFFSIIHTRNYGAAFGFLNDSDMEWQFWLFAAATVFAVAVILYMARGAKKNAYVLITALGLILGGAVGNFIDRVRFRSVVDFLDVYVGAYHWPAFNVADSAICVGACFMLWCIYKQK